jgi:hypothetical protein
MRTLPPCRRCRASRRVPTAQIVGLVAAALLPAAVADPLLAPRRPASASPKRRAASRWMASARRLSPDAVPFSLQLGRLA